MSVSKSLAMLYRRDLRRLIQQIEAFPDDQTLWQTVPGCSNPAGNLALHLEGNLREFIGRQLGGAAYSRNRPEEFAAKGAGRAEIIARLEDVAASIPSIVEGLSGEQLAAEYPEAVLQRALSTEAFAMSLYGHLNWHLGQMDYLRRALTGHGAIALAGLGD